MRVRPVSPGTLVAELADWLAARDPESWLRVAVDGAPAAQPEVLAEALLDPLRVRGRAACHVPAEGFLRPASLRFEWGRTNPDSFYEGWLDEAGLRREVLDRVMPGGPGTILPSLWDSVTDRASRAGYQAVPAGGIVLVSGALLLGGGLPFDATVHLAVSAAALARRTPAELRWTLAAYARYDAEVGPMLFADRVIRMDDPRRPALVEAA